MVILGLGEILGLGGILRLDGNTKFFRSKPAAQQSGPDPEKRGVFFLAFAKNSLNS